MLVGLLVLVLAYAGYRVAKSSNNTTYGSSLEQYISSHNPQHSGDVERLTVEYNMKVSRGVL
jgi:acyl-ACP thioesterase